MGACAGGGTVGRQLAVALTLPSTPYFGPLVRALALRRFCPEASDK